MAAKKRPRGHPSPEEVAEITENILSAATSLFLDHGYSATAMESVVKTASISKATLYSRFRDKRDLFSAVVRRLSGRDAAAKQPSNTLDDTYGGLLEYALFIYDITTAGDRLSLHKIGMRESWQFPDVAEILAAEARRLYMDDLQCYLDALAERDNLGPVNVAKCARLFQSMVLSEINNELQAGHPVPGRDRVLEHLKWVVQIFLMGCSAGGRAPAWSVRPASAPPDCEALWI